MLRKTVFFEMMKYRLLIIYIKRFTRIKKYVIITKRLFGVVER